MPQESKPRLNDAINKHLSSVRRWTGLGLWSEELTRAFWPLFYWTCLFALLWLVIPAFKEIPDHFFRLSSFLFYAGLATLFIRGVFIFHLPSRQEVDRRIEQSPEAHHHPLSALKDTLANPGKPHTEYLWAQRFKDLLPALKKLSPRAPESVLPEKDPAALRLLFSVILITAFVVIGPAQGMKQVTQGLWPLSDGQDIFGRTKSAEVIVTPPAYTRLPPLKITGWQKDTDAPLTLPAGSTYEARLSGGIGTPKILMGDTARPLEKTGSGLYNGAGDLSPAKTFELRQLFTPRVYFKYRLKTDTPPRLARNGEIHITNRGEIQIPLSVTDDYGIEKIQIRMSYAGKDKPPAGEDYDEIKTVMTKGGNEAQDIDPVFDLTFHPWAGQKVMLTLLALDAKGQSDVLPPFEITLPERPFYNDAARRVIETRKRLIEAPDSAYSVAQTGLINAVERPAAYQGDLTVFLGLSSAIYRLQYSPSVTTANALIDLLWKIAVRIEDGGSGQSYATLQEIQEKLQKALADPNSTPEDIAALMQEFQMALASYFQNLAHDMAMKMQQGGNNQSLQKMMNMEMLSSMITPQDLAQFLAEMQKQVLEGNKDAAREMLSRLSNLMQAMRPGAMNNEMPPEIVDLQNQMEALQKLTERQKELRHDIARRMEGVEEYKSYQRTLEALKDVPGIEDMLKTLRPEVQNHFTPPNVSMDMKKEQAIQENLHAQLGKLMDEINGKTGQTPQNLGKAQNAMQGASEALADNAPVQAAGQQDAAIAALEEAQKQMNQKMMQMLQQMMGLSLGGAPRLDPFGRPVNEGDGGRLNPLLGREVKIPDQAERRKIDEILDILRKRSGELSRPQEERDYYKRLLELF